MKNIRVLIFQNIRIFGITETMRRLKRILVDGEEEKDGEPKSQKRLKGLSAFGGPLEASWGSLGGLLEASWRPLGDVLGHLGGILEHLHSFLGYL